jgi:hypothetical protein
MLFIFSKSFEFVIQNAIFFYLIFKFFLFWGILRGLCFKDLKFVLKSVFSICLVVVSHFLSMNLFVFIYDVSVIVVVYVPLFLWENVKTTVASH